MTFTQLNQVILPKQIGRIVLENANGLPTQTVCWNMHPIRRDAELVCEDGIYQQQRQDETGTWHYRYDRSRGPHPTDSNLSDYQSVNRGR